MIKTIKLRNTLNRTFNGVKANGFVNVEEKDVDGYIANGFAPVEQKYIDAKANAKKELKEKKNADKEKAKADAEAKAQAEAQAKLDEEHAKANAKNTQEVASTVDENAQNDDAVDLDGDSATDDKKLAENETKLEDANDGDALINELDKVPAPKKTK